MEVKSKLLLLYLSEVSERELAKFLKVADQRQILSIKEVALNLLLGNFKLKEEEKKALKKHKRFLREFASKKSKLNLKGKAKVVAKILRIAAPTLKEL